MTAELDVAVAVTAVSDDGVGLEVGLTVTLVVGGDGAAWAMLGVMKTATAKAS